MGILEPKVNGTSFLIFPIKKALTKFQYPVIYPDIHLEFVWLFEAMPPFHQKPI